MAAFLPDQADQSSSSSYARPGCVQKAPSQLVDELLHPPKEIQGWRPKPTVVELLNIAEYSHQVTVLLLLSHHWCVTHALTF